MKENLTNRYHSNPSNHTLFIPDGGCGDRQQLPVVVVIPNSFAIVYNIVEYGYQ